MKTNILMLQLIFFITTGLFAQPGHEGTRDQIQSMKVAFITNELSLTPEESQQFWPLYNQRQEKIEEIKRSVSDPGSKIMYMSDEELDNFVMKQFEAKKKEVDLNMEYYQKFKKFLPIRKIAQLPGAEMKFNKMLVNELRKREQNRNSDKRPGFGPRG